MNIGNLFSKISPDQAVRREIDQRSAMDILMTSPDDERYNTIRPNPTAASAPERRSGMDIIMTRPDDERYNTIRPY